MPTAERRAHAREDDRIRAELFRHPDAGPHALTRRRFLQALGAGAGALALHQALGPLEAFAAPPVASGDGILVLVTLDGGNDGLSSWVPYGDGRYHDHRPNVRIAPERVLPVTDTHGFHPALGRLKARFDGGDVAVVRGVGASPPELSHFVAMDRWMHGWGGPLPADGRRNGWIGRYLDGLPGAATEPLYGVTVGSRVPLHLIGSRTQASALPLRIASRFGVDRREPADDRMYRHLEGLAAQPTGVGPWGDAWAATLQRTFRLGSSLPPAYVGPLPSGFLTRQLVLCARLVNAGLGIRVLNTMLSGFDTHADQPGAHDRLMAELDAAIDAFFATLAPAWRSQVVLMTFSEFGRRPRANLSNGTDHGTASSFTLLLGDQVRGGLYGAEPDLGNLDRDGNLRPTVDFRALYATVLDRWLGADSQALLGARYEDLGLLDPPGAAPRPAPPVIPPDVRPYVPPPPRAVAGYTIADLTGRVFSFGEAPQMAAAAGVERPIVALAGRARGGCWACTAAGDLFGLGGAPGLGSLRHVRLNHPIVGLAATPTGDGCWMVASDGGIFSFGDAAFHGSTGAIRLNRPIVGMAPTPSGRGYWLVASDGGIFTFGDAPFLGSTGAIRLNRPIVGMAPTPSGRGYWLVASDGGIFTFGDAPFFGSTGGIRLNQPIVGMAATSTGGGYWLVAADGGVFAFGDAPFAGSAAGRAFGAVGLVAAR